MRHPRPIITAASKIAVLIVFLAMAVTSSAEVFYKWKDAGQWVYGEHPPNGVDAVAVKTNSNRSKTQNSDGQEADEASENADQEGDETLTAEEVARQEKHASYCKHAKENIEALSSDDVIRQRDAEDNVTILSDEDRANEIEKAKLAVEKYC